MSYCSHTSALTVDKFSAKRRAFGVRLCLSMRVLAGVERPSKREIRPKLLTAIACLDGLAAVSSRELLDVLSVGWSGCVWPIPEEADLLCLTVFAGRTSFSRAERAVAFLVPGLLHEGVWGSVFFTLVGLLGCCLGNCS